MALSYALKKDLHGCYKKAKEDSKMKYMKRVKEYLNETHPELAFSLPKET